MTSRRADLCIALIAAITLLWVLFGESSLPGD
jgi:hypothetical protein